MDKYLVAVHVKDNRNYIGLGDKVIKILIFGDNPIDKVLNHLYSLKIYSFKIEEITKVYKGISLEDIDEILE